MDIPGWKIERVCGEVFGLTVRSRNAFSQMGAGLKSMFGGELQGMTKNLVESRNEVMGRMLAGEGELEGTRLLAPRTIRLMASNHLGADLASMSTGGFAETSFQGVGFGLGFAVLEEPLKLHSPASRGEFYWGGIYSTGFWVDPVDAVSCVFMTQLMPSSYHPIRSQLRQHVYSALVR